MLLPAGKPDADNLLKIAADALRGIVLADDASVVDARMIKSYFRRSPAAHRGARIHLVCCCCGGCGLACSVASPCTLQLRFAHRIDGERATLNGRTFGQVARDLGDKKERDPKARRSELAEA